MIQQKNIGCRWSSSVFAADGDQWQTPNWHENQWPVGCQRKKTDEYQRQPMFFCCIIWAIMSKKCALGSFQCLRCYSWERNAGAKVDQISCLVHSLTNLSLLSHLPFQVWAKKPEDDRKDLRFLLPTTTSIHTLRGWRRPMLQKQRDVSCLASDSESERERDYFPAWQEGRKEGRIVYCLSQLQGSFTLVALE